jgi:hypothetical protein
MTALAAWLRSLWAGIIRDATPAESACESCDWQMAIHCNDEQAATCKLRLAEMTRWR